VLALKMTVNNQPRKKMKKIIMIMALALITLSGISQESVDSRAIGGMGGQNRFGLSYAASVQSREPQVNLVDAVANAQLLKDWQTFVMTNRSLKPYVQERSYLMSTIPTLQAQADSDRNTHRVDSGAIANEDREITKCVNRLAEINKLLAQQKTRYFELNKPAVVARLTTLN
jgi:hypothetical protein